jgi:hypothetical protein
MGGTVFGCIGDDVVLDNPSYCRVLLPLRRVAYSDYGSDAGAAGEDSGSACVAT